MIRPDKLFEILVAIILRKNGFLSFLPSHRIGGRSQAGHQIDSAGIYLLRIPFVYPIVLITEAKLWRSRSVDLPVVRNMLGVLNDLRQTLPNNMSTSICWPTDFYSGNITATYLGAIFSNGKFAWTANRYAYSHGIFLVPVPITSSWVDYLLGKLDDLYRTHQCPHNCLDNVRGSWRVIDKLFDNSYVSLDDNERNILLESIHMILLRCPKFSELNDLLNSLHIASVDGIPVLLEIDADSMAELYQLALKIESEKQMRIEEKTATGFETWFEPEFGLRGSITLLESWPVAYQESISENENEWIPLYETIINFRTIKKSGKLLLLKEVVDYLKGKEDITLSLVLSRSLIGQISIQI